MANIDIKKLGNEANAIQLQTLGNGELLISTNKAELGISIVSAEELPRLIELLASELPEPKRSAVLEALNHR